MVKIFVYGTLRRGMANYERYLKNKSHFIGYGYVKGTLQTIKNVCYPALVLTGVEDILGEIYEVNENVVSQLNRLENYRGYNDLNNEYHKCACMIYDENHVAMEMIDVFVFNVDNLANAARLGIKINCNDYVKYVRGE